MATFAELLAASAPSTLTPFEKKVQNIANEINVKASDIKRGWEISRRNEVWFAQEAQRQVAFEIDRARAQKQQLADRAEALRTGNIFKLVSMFYADPRDIEIGNRLEDKMPARAYDNDTISELLDAVRSIRHDLEVWIGQGIDITVNRQIQETIDRMPKESHVYRALKSVLSAKK